MGKKIIGGLLFVYLSTGGINGYGQLKDASWLLGTWKMQIKNGEIVETWQHINDSTFQNKSYILKTSGDTIPQETVQLTYRNKQMFYTPTVSGQNNNQAVKFKITTFDKTQFIAENPEHDFPQRIIYKLKSPSQLYARIEGNHNGKFSKEEFNMIKAR